MRRLLYRSRATGETEAAAVVSIVEKSVRNNPMRRLTGFLLHFDDRFVQFVEGPPVAVEALLNDLEADPRHTDLVILFDESGGDARWFAGWDMKHLITFGGTSDGRASLAACRH